MYNMDGEFIGSANTDGLEELSGNDDKSNGSGSLESDNEIPETSLEYNVSGKADGLEKYLLCFSVSNMELSAIQASVDNLGTE